MRIKLILIIAAVASVLTTKADERKYYDCTLLGISHGNPKAVVDFDGSMNGFLSDGSLAIWDGKAVENVKRDRDGRIVSFVTPKFRYDISYNWDFPSTTIHKIMFSPRYPQASDELQYLEIYPEIDKGNIKQISYYAPMAENGKTEDKLFMYDYFSDLTVDSLNNACYAIRTKFQYNPITGNVDDQTEKRGVERIIDYWPGIVALDSVPSETQIAALSDLIMRPFGFEYNLDAKKRDYEAQFTPYLISLGAQAYDSVEASSMRTHYNNTPPIDFLGYKFHLDEENTSSDVFFGGNMRFKWKTSGPENEIKALAESMSKSLNSLGIYCDKNKDYHYFTSSYPYTIAQTKKTLVQGQYLSVDVKKLQGYDNWELQLTYYITAIKP